ncbi:MAG: FtsX-like permease family protein, partial [Methanocellales archaeon]
AVIGDKLAKKLEVRVRDVALLSYPDAKRSVRIIGLIHTGTSIDETLVYTSLFMAQSFYGVNDVVNEIAIRVDDIYIADEVSREIERETEYRAASWIESLSDLLAFLESQYGMILLYYALIFIIAGFGIANVLIMIVSAKIKEIGMLMAMGATRRSIAEIFIIQSMVFACIGIAIGSIVAYVLELLLQSYPISTPEEIYFGLTFLPVEINLQNFLIAAVFAFLISAIVGVYPALQASKLDPVEALRVV